MAVTQLISSLPDMPIEKNYTIQFEAIDPVSGLAVTGVTVNKVSITTDQATDLVQTAAIPPNVLGAYLPPETAGTSTA